MGFLTGENCYMVTSAQHLVTALFPYGQCFATLQEAVLGNPLKHCYFFFNSHQVASEAIFVPCTEQSAAYSRGFWLLCLCRDHRGFWQSWGGERKSGFGIEAGYWDTPYCPVGDSSVGCEVSHWTIWVL